MHIRSLRGPAFLRAPEDGQGGGGVQHGADDIATARALAAAEKGRADAAVADLAKLKDANAATIKADEARKKKEADDQLDIKTRLDLSIKEGDAHKTRIAAFEKAMSDRLEAQLKALPEKKREQLAKFRDKVELAVFAEMVEDAAVDTMLDTPPPPGGGGGLGPGPPGAPGLHRPSQGATDLLTNMGAHGALARLKTMESVPKEGNPTESKFRIPVEKFFPSMARNLSSNMGR